MKRYLFSIILILLLCSTCFAQKKVGKVIHVVNNVDITSLKTGKRMVPIIGTSITIDHKIRTGKKSYAQLLLNDGTVLSIKEVSVLNIAALILKEEDLPTRIRVLTGKLRVTVKKLFKNRTLILKTPTAIAGVRGTDFGVITSRSETKVVVFDGKVDVANKKRRITRSYTLKKGEESTIRINRPPTRPVLVPRDILKSWFDSYQISKDNKIILKKREERGFIDRLIRKMEY